MLVRVKNIHHENTAPGDFPHGHPPTREISNRAGTKNECDGRRLKTTQKLFSMITTNSSYRKGCSKYLPYSQYDATILATFDSPGFEQHNEVRGVTSSP